MYVCEYGCMCMCVFMLCEMIIGTCIHMHKQIHISLANQHRTKHEERVYIHHEMFYGR